MRLTLATLGHLVDDAAHMDTRRQGGELNCIGERASGARDWRMLAPALTMWCSCMATSAALERMRGWLTASAAGTPTWLISACMVCIGVLGIALATMTHSGRTRRPTAMSVLAVLTAALIAMTSTCAAVLTSWQDPAYRWAQGQRGITSVTAVVEAPPLRSDIRQYDCQAELRLRSIVDAERQAPSSLRVMVFATRRSCTAIRQGATVRIVGSLRMSSFANTSVWLTAHGDQAITAVKPANAVLSMVTTMRENFFEQTDRLSEQGQVLVPGLTVGILGQDRIAMGTSSHATDSSDAYSAQVEQWFMSSGIMHLMAVSGGHFLLIAVLCKRLGGILKVPRRVVTIMMLAAFTALGHVVYPSASVWRAWGMGVLMCAAMWIGRSFQTVAGLSWLVMLTLLFDHRMAFDFGFALSCSAVLSMAWLAPRIAESLNRVMPAVVADGLAVTISAQMGTMPIQILLEPQLPIWSIAANLLVAPVVNLATVLGLLGFILASLVPPLGFAVVWAAQCFTGVIEAVARWVSSGSLVMIPWVGGVLGAMLLLGVEAAVLIGVLWIRQSVKEPAADGGVRYRHHVISQLRVWWRDTLGMLGSSVEPQDQGLENQIRDRR